MTENAERGTRMRGLKSLEVTGEDTQQCRILLDKAFKELGIAENDVISIDYQWNQCRPLMQKPANVTLVVFYWQPNRG